jgi:hypothetical protein
MTLRKDSRFPFMTGMIPAPRHRVCSHATVTAPGSSPPEDRPARLPAPLTACRTERRPVICLGRPATPEHRKPVPGKSGSGRHSAPPANAGSVPYTCQHRNTLAPGNVQAVPQINLPADSQT